MTTVPPTHRVQPVPGQVISVTLRKKLSDLDHDIGSQQGRCDNIAADLDVAKFRLAELKAARAEISAFLGLEAAKA